MKSKIKVSNEGVTIELEIGSDEDPTSLTKGLKEVSELVKSSEFQEIIQTVADISKEIAPKMPSTSALHEVDKEVEYKKKIDQKLCKDLFVGTPPNVKYVGVKKGIKVTSTSRKIALILYCFGKEGLSISEIVEIGLNSGLFETKKEADTRTKLDNNVRVELTGRKRLLFPFIEKVGKGKDVKYRLNESGISWVEEELFPSIIEVKKNGK